ncbi:hypothetical protein [Bacillus alkalicellulosilyticus]|uniref:hypothetical protein n=1 Tax=Alkalihalobacterium alkalicellulosilyticum TaxID=1912214 RepID=UPI000998343E|nr:hypothetical protein [Bacillus alkalicellulosilyticus]
MADILYDLFLIVFGIILGMIAKDPLKKIVTGKYKEEARQKKRVKLLIYIRENSAKTAPTTEELAEKVFSGKLDISLVNELLLEIEQFNLIKSIPSKNQDLSKTKWISPKK